MAVSVPAIGFHLTNASRKLAVSGRAQTNHLAASPGDIAPASGN